MNLKKISVVLSIAVMLSSLMMTNITALSANNTSVVTCEIIHSDGTKTTKSYNNFFQAVRETDYEERIITVNEDVKFASNSGTTLHGKLTINAAEGKTVTLTGLPTRTYATMFTFDSGDEDLYFGLGITGGRLIIDDNGGWDTIYIGENGKATFEFGPNFTAKKFVDSEMNIGSGKFIVNGADISNIYTIKSGQNDSTAATSTAEITIKGNAKFNELRYSTSKIASVNTEKYSNDNYKIEQTTNGDYTYLKRVGKMTMPQSAKMSDDNTNFVLDYSNVTDSGRTIYAAAYDNSGRLLDVASRGNDGKCTLKIGENTAEIKGFIWDRYLTYLSDAFIHRPDDGVTVSWNDISPINTFTPDNVSFTADFVSKSESATEYVISYKIDNDPEVTETVTVPPTGSESRTIFIPLDAGIYDTEIKVTRGEEVLYQSNEKITVMQHYTGEWGDKITRRGWAAHVAKYIREIAPEKVPDYFVYSGAQGYRDGSNWEYIEKEKGKMSFGNLQSEYGEMAKTDLKMSHLNGCGNGWLYLPERDMKLSDGWNVHTKSNIPQTDESITAFTNYMAKLAKYSADNLNAYTMETWNEYNVKVQANESEEVAQIYTDSVRPIRIKMMLENDETLDNFDISAFSAGGWGEDTWLHNCVNLDFYPFFDRVSVHKYIQRQGFESNDVYHKEVKKFVDYVTEWGGWKEVDNTETGFTNPPGSTSFATAESADWETPQILATSEDADVSWTYFYDLKNDGSDNFYTEYNFGSLTYNYKPKPQYIAYTNFNNMTSGGMMMGPINTGLPAGTKAYMYYKDGKPVIIAWANLPDDSDVEWNIGGNVKVYDNHGTLVTESTSNVILNGEPKYIMNADRSYITAAVNESLSEKAADFMSKYDGVLTSELKTKAQTVFDNAKTTLVGAPDETKAYNVYKDYMNLGNEIITAGRNGELTEKETSSMLYTLYLAAKRANNLYAASYTGNVPDKVSDGWTSRYNAVRANNYDNLSIQQYTDAMLKYIRNHINDAKELFSLEANPQKAGMIKAINTLTEDMCTWYDSFASYETVKDLSLTVQTPYYDRHTYANTDVTTEVNLHNYGKQPFKGKITVTDDNDKLLYETAPVTVSANGGYTQTSVTVNIPKPADGNVAHLYINYVDETGKTVHSQKTEYVVDEIFTVKPLPVTETISNFNTIKLEIANVTDKARTATINVESDGSFTFDKTQFSVNVPANGTEIVEMPISNVVNNKFHFYSFNYSVKDTNNVIVAKGNEAVSFTNIVKAKTPVTVDGFTGDISDWEDAYPIYINQPNKVTEQSSWLNANCSARAFAKWDENNLYVLIDVFDDKHLQTFTGANIPNGDSIQIGLDIANDKKVGSYASDDYEMYISAGPIGNEAYFLQKPNTNTSSNGVVDWFTCKRNNTINTSRYLLVLNKSIISELNLEEHSMFGMNFVINDSDYLERDNRFCFTDGMYDEKNPSKWASFKLVASENSELNDSSASTIFPIDIKSY